MPKKGKGSRRAKIREQHEHDADTPAAGGATGTDTPHGELSDKMKRLLADVEYDDDNEQQAKPTQKQDKKSDVDLDENNEDGSDEVEEADEESSVRTRYRIRTVGRNLCLWICDIHGSRCAIYGSILCAEIHGLMDCAEIC